MRAIVEDATVAAAGLARTARTARTGIVARVSVEQIGPEDAAAALEGGAVAVDVREDDEWEAGRIAGAVHIPLAELSDRLAELDPTRRTIFVCRVGSRSDVAAALADRAGFADPANLAGGLHAWAATGLPLEPDDGEVL
jgi:rhodanese-related sulfurtransferase